MVQKVTIPEISKIAQDNVKDRITEKVIKISDDLDLKDEEKFIEIENLIKEQLEMENEITKLIDESGNSEI